jgi:hypothetical protein
MSTIAARKSQPSQVQTYVMSVTHTRFGEDAWNSRATTFGAIASECFESVVAR